MPPGFSWVDPPHLAALAFPDADDLLWLRRNGVQVLLSLTEDPPLRTWVNDAGLMHVHLPVLDMDAPQPEQLDAALAAIQRANAAGMGVAVHCAAGRGRTGTVLAVYFVAQGLTARSSVEKVRGLRPGSIETPEQERAVEQFAHRSVFHRDKTGGTKQGKTAD